MRSRKSLGGRGLIKNRKDSPRKKRTPSKRVYRYINLGSKIQKIDHKHLNRVAMESLLEAQVKACPFIGWHIWDLNYSAVEKGKDAIWDAVGEVVKCHKLNQDNCYVYIDPVGDFTGCGFLILRTCGTTDLRRVGLLDFISDRISDKALPDNECAEFVGQFKKENIAERIKVGDPVKIIDGPFRNLSGSVLSVGKLNVGIDIELIHSEFIVDIPVDWIEVS